MPSLRDFAMRLIQGSPAVADSEMNRNIIDVIQRGDAEEAKRIAENLCQSHGVAPQDAFQQAMGFFNKR